MSSDLSMNVLMMGLVRPSRANLATRMAEKAEAGIPNALSNICTVKGATLVPAAVEVSGKNEADNHIVPLRKPMESHYAVWTS